jgi:hypothetical protein
MFLQLWDYEQKQFFSDGSQLNSEPGIRWRTGTGDKPIKTIYSG